jgi:hypothetical protein
MGGPVPDLYVALSGVLVRPEIRFPIRPQSPFHFNIPLDTLYVVSSPGEMQNFSESSVNFEVIRAGGLDQRFLPSLKLDVHFP